MTAASRAPSRRVNPFLGLFRRTYNTLRPRQALDETTPRQACVTGTGTQ
jgi:transposase InsO family protein